MRALIVEDEKTPRELLRDLVPWTKYGFDQVVTAKNGIEALDTLEAGEVDLVVTDVRMPKMDGVELALEVRRRGHDCVLVFLSGFSDKDYLKAAIRVHAQDYLDKPIDLDQVEQAVRRAAETIRERQQSAEETQRDEQVLKELSPLRRQAQAQALFRLGPGPWATLEPRFAAGPLRALFVGLSHQTVSVGWSAAVLALVNGDDFPFPSFAAAPTEGGTVALACDRVLAIESASFDRAVGEVLGLVAALDPTVPVMIGVAPPVGTPGAMAGALAEAKTALVDAFYRPSQRIYPVKPPSGRTFDFPRETAHQWRELLGRKDYPGLAGQIDQLKVRALTARDPDLTEVRQVWLSAMGLILAEVPSWGPAERQSRAEKLRLDFEAAGDLDTLAAQAQDCFSRLFLRSPGDLHAEDRVGKAIRFIETRFADPDLTVDDVAAHAGFSESYFCTVFKQVQGTTVKDFVTRLRIDRAKAYLWEKDPPTLADLALKVGFRDPNYFSTVFKRLTGTSPGAYRKKALG
jgi:two-component system response regulator YesN